MKIKIDSHIEDPIILNSLLELGVKHWGDVEKAGYPIIYNITTTSENLFAKVHIAKHGTLCITTIRKGIALENDI